MSETQSQVFTAANLPAGAARLYRAGDPALDGGLVEVAFVDTAVPDYKTLADDVRPGVEVVLVSGAHALEQAAAWLAGREGIAAIHILSHGSAGDLIVGGETVSDANVAAYQATFAAIGASLRPGGDLMLYGCDVGAGAAGQHLVEQIANYSRADVAASNDLTGAAVLGGNWDLEVAVGTIDTATAISAAADADYQHVLQLYALTDNSNNWLRSAGYLYFENYNDLQIYTNQIGHIGHTDQKYGAVAQYNSTTQEELTVRYIEPHVFDVYSLDVWGGLDEGGNGYDIVLSPDDGSPHYWTVHVTHEQAIVGPITVDLSANPFRGLLSLTVQAFGTVAVRNLATTPQLSFVGSTTALTVAHDSGGVGIAGLVHGSDPIAGYTDTWSVSSQAGHGTVTVSGATAASGGSDITPGGTLTYTPTAGYVGADSFVIQLSNGTTTTTRTLSVTVAGPAVSGGSANQIVNDNSTGAPLAGVTVTDNVSGGEALAVTVTLKGGALYGDLGNTAGWTAGTSGSDKVYTRSFASAGTQAADAQAAVRALTWVPVAHGGAVGSSSAATEIDVTIANGAAQATDTANTVKTAYVNTAPVRSAGGGATITWSNGGPALAIAPALAFSDPDYNATLGTAAGNWSGGSLDVDVSANRDTANDIIGILNTTGGITTTGGTTAAGNTVYYGGTAIGTIAANADGSANHHLTVTFNGAAGSSAVSALAEAISFSATGTASTSARTVTFTAADGGGTSASGSGTVDVVLGPSVLSINRADGAAGLTHATDVSFTVTFSEAMSNVAAANFSLSGTDGTGAIGTPTSADGGVTWSVPVSGVSGDGTLGLDLSSIDGIVAAVGAGALVGTRAGDEAYTIDTTAPVLGNLNGDSRVFVIGEAAVLLDTGTDATVVEANIALGGVLTASITNVIGADESLGIQTTAGGITTTAAGGTVTILDNGTAIGSYTAAGNGSGGNDLVVSLNAGDTAAEVQHLLQALTYGDSNASATAQDRMVNITLADAAGNMSVISAVTVHDDNRPVVTAGHSPSVVRTAAAAAVDATVSLSAAGAIWNGGTLVVQITANADASHDALSLPSANPGGNAIWLDATGGQLMAGATQIGTASATSASGGTAWTFTFSANATTAQVQAAADAVRLAVAAGGSLATRTVSFTATDGHGVASTTVIDSVTVLAEPTISGGSSHAVNDNATVTPFSGVTIADGSSEGVTVTITFAAAAGGFTGASGWTSGSSGSNATYTKSFASVSEANTGLAAFSFAPTAHLGNVGTSQGFTFNVSATGNTTGLSTGTDSAASANVSYVNTAPTLTAGGGGTPSYTTGQAPVRIDTGLLVADPDNGGVGNWNSGSLLAHIASNADTANDTLSIANAGGITVVGNTVSYNSTQIGTIDNTKSGAPGRDLLITFTGAATDAAVKALAQAIQFGGSGMTTNGSARSVALTVTDGGGATSSTTDSVNIVLGPSVLSIQRNANTPAFTNAKTVTFDVTFSTAVTGITAADFTLAKSGTATGSIASVTGSGAIWTVTASGVSGNGTLTLNQTATVAGRDGNGLALVGSHGGDQSVTIDTTPPGAPSITGLTAATDSGTSNHDGITNITIPTVQGTAEAGSKVTVYVDKTRLGTAIADGSGNWTFNTTSPLAQGSHAFTARATDVAGNVGVMSAAYGVSILTTPPTVTAYLASDASENPAEQEGPAWGASGLDSDDYETSATLSGTGLANTAVTFWEGGAWINGVPTGAIQLSGGTTTDAQGKWTFTPGSLTQGAHTIFAKQTDAAGNIGTSGRGVFFVYDTAPPVLTMALATDSGSSPSDRTTNSPILTGIADGNADASGVVTLKEGSSILGTANVAANGIWSFAPNRLSQGTHTLTASQTDYAGNTGTTSLSFTYDSVAPTVSVKLQSDTGASSSDRITALATLAGGGDANATVTLKEGGTTLGSTTANGAGAWSFTPTGLSQGAHTITATQTDVAGNVGSTVLTFTCDTQSPTATWRGAPSRLAALQGTNGLTAAGSIAILSGAGGLAGDAYGFTLLAGSSSGLSLAPAENGAALSVGSSGLNGSASGTVYTALVKVTDTTNGLSTNLAPFDLVVGSGANNAINLRTLGIATTTPTFVYGLAGADTMIGSGMVADLSFVGGAGADTMTGGSGANSYVFGAASDSTASAMDIITNFNGGQDLIDLSGITGLTSYQGAVTTSVAAHSVGWQSSGGNTFIYANTSGVSEALGSANMKIELLGNISLTGGNIHA